MISAIVLTRNEEKIIGECLNSLLWCDETIIIDDESEDGTVKIAKKFGAKVYIKSLENDFSSQRNFGLEKAKGEWVLFVDADEVVSQALWFEIMQHTNSPTNSNIAYQIKRQDIIWNTQLKHGENGNTKLLRLAKKNAGKWTGSVHETWNVKGNIALLNNPLTHYPHVSVEYFLRDINFYTNIRAEELYSQKKKSTWIHIIIYPFAKFTQNYLFKQGFRDGVPGLMVAMMMSFHSFLARSKLWQKRQKQK